MDARFQQVLYVLDRLGRRRWMFLAPGIVAVLLRLALLPAMPAPEPRVHDEFSYLLGADTLVHGRLTNPPHPRWRFFETLQVLSVPTYASKYPPGQALFLAAGQTLAGSPFAGVLLGLAFFSSSVTWMLMAWVPPGFALLGGVFTAVAFGSGHYWTESYWGGAVAAAASALLLGAFGRIRRGSRPIAVWPLAAGAILLWLTRPFEGGFLVLAISVLLACLAVRRQLTWERGGARLAITLLGCAAATFGGQAYYNWRVTGDVLRLPYLLYQEQYIRAPILWFQPVRVPTFEAGPVVRSFHTQAEIETLGSVTSGSPVERARRLIFRVFGIRGSARAAFGFSWPFLVGLLSLSCLFCRDRGMRVAWVITLTCAVPCVLTAWTFAHYLAVLVVPLLALAFRTAWRLRQYHAHAAPLLLTALLAAALGGNGARALRTIRSPGTAFPYPVERAHVLDRARITRGLESDGGSHVIFVRYSPAHDPHAEWVYNGADIDRQQVVWARDLGADENRALVSYYPGRRFWVLEADDSPPRLRPLPIRR